MRWIQFADAENQLQRRWCGGRMLRTMICAAVITPSLVMFVLAFLMNLLFSNEPSYYI